jgi:hypothetical protein
MPKARYDYRLPHHRITHEQLHVDHLTVNPQAQRILNEPRAKRMADTFLPQAAGTLIVSRRDGVNYVVDGQHRLVAARMAGVSQLQCEIHHGLSLADEAELFLIKNRDSKPPSKIDEFRIGVLAGHPLFVSIQAVLDKHNLGIAPGLSANSLGAVQSLVRIVERCSVEALDQALYVAEAAFTRTRGECWEGVLLTGLAMFLHRHLPNASSEDLDTLARKMAEVGPMHSWRGRIASLATDGGTRDSGTQTRNYAAYKLVAAAWNRNKRPSYRVKVD